MDATRFPKCKEIWLKQRGYQMNPTKLVWESKDTRVHAILNSMSGNNFWTDQIPWNGKEPSQPLFSSPRSTQLMYFFQGCFGIFDRVM
jgi:hypothetical protein